MNELEVLRRKNISIKRPPISLNCQCVLPYCFVQGQMEDMHFPVTILGYLGS